MNLPSVREQRRLHSPGPAPQALAWHGGNVWLGSRDLRQVYQLEPQSWNVLQQIDAPGIPWAAVSTGGTLQLTIGEGANDDRYVYRYSGDGTFQKLFACPEFTGSYLSYDGSNLYLSQWYKQRILKLDQSGDIIAVIDVGAEISGHTFTEGAIYVLRGTEENGESWTIARLDPREERPCVTDLATVPFACRSLAFDGTNFWSNHRAAGEVVAFSLP
ncbi:MAG: hypothetical protein ACR2FX_04205 [Chthoniobacterales bacterium]